MRTQTALLVTGLLLLLAVAPWLVSSCSQRPLLPDELRQERTDYEARVDAAQAATMEAQRQGESIRKVIPLGTVAVTASAPTTLPITATMTTAVTALAGVTATPVPPSSTVIVTPTATITQRATSGTNHGSSVVIVRTTILTPTVAATLTTTATAPVTTNATVPITATGTVTPVVTTRVVVIRANATPAAPTSAPVDGNRSPSAPSRPAGLVESVDVISEEMLAEQVEKDASDAAISDVSVNLTPNGFSATANINIGLGLKRPAEMQAEFVVENDSLVVNVTSIRLNGLDVTDKYASELEERINSELYQLLPERYVDTFELSNGQVTVQSQMKP